MQKVVGITVGHGDGTQHHSEHGEVVGKELETQVKAKEISWKTQLDVVKPTQSEESQSEDQGKIDNQEFGIKVGDSGKLDGMGCSSEADVSGSEIENRGVCQNQNIKREI